MTKQELRKYEKLRREVFAMVMKAGDKIERAQKLIDSAWDDVLMRALDTMNVFKGEMEKKAGKK